MAIIWGISVASTEKLLKIVAAEFHQNISLSEVACGAAVNEGGDHIKELFSLCLYTRVLCKNP